jgi:hypothetical protein
MHSLLEKIYTPFNAWLSRNTMMALLERKTLVHMKVNYTHIMGFVGAYQNLRTLNYDEMIYQDGEFSDIRTLTYRLYIEGKSYYLTMTLKKRVILTDFDRLSYTAGFGDGIFDLDDEQLKQEQREAFLNRSCKLMKSTFTDEEKLHLEKYKKQGWKFLYNGEPYTLDEAFQLIPVPKVPFRMGDFERLVSFEKPLTEEVFTKICEHIEKFNM